MKKSLYIIIALILALSSCQEDEIQSDIPGNNSYLKFTVNIPQYKSTTRAVSYENDLKDMVLLTFDSNGIFLKRVQATNLDAQESDG